MMRDIVNRRLHRFVVGQVRCHADDLPVRVLGFQLVERLVYRLLPTAEQRYLCAVLQIGAHDREADAARTARYDCNFSL